MTQKFSHTKNSDKTIWVDLDNSPHVPFFAPIINKFRNKGYNVEISARVYSQTVLLADLYDLDYTPIGKHHGKNKFIKVIGLLYRSLQLLPYAIKKRPTIAISHGSRSQMIVAQLLRIPIVMFLDYEYIQTIPFVKPKLIFLPSIISTDRLKSLAARIIGYPGIKEDIYVPGFIPNQYLGQNLHLKENTIKVVLRPPAHEAHYHNPESEKLFDAIITFLTNNKVVQTIILPRDNRQKDLILNKYKSHFESNNLIIPDEVIDGLNLMWHSDLVISGGGTMNREAAALGVPVYSIFKGKIGDVDKYLEEQNRLTLISGISDIESKIKIKRRDKKEKLENLNSLVLHSVVSYLEEFIIELTGSFNENLIDETQYEHKLSNGRESKA